MCACIFYEFIYFLSSFQFLLRDFYFCLYSHFTLFDLFKYSHSVNNNEQNRTEHTKKNPYQFIDEISNLVPSYAYASRFCNVMTHFTGNDEPDEDGKNIEQNKIALPILGEISLSTSVCVFLSLASPNFLSVSLSFLACVCVPIRIIQFSEREFMYFPCFVRFCCSYLRSDV